jgi:hypothetical protein
MQKIMAIALSLFLSNTLFSQATHKGLPLIKAQQLAADYRTNSTWVKGNWRISPEITPDVLSIPCYNKEVDFAFYTDVDSIRFTINGNKAQQFYVVTPDNQYALTEVRGFNYTPVQFDVTPKPASYPFYYETNSSNAYLHQFQSQYFLKDLVQGLKTDSAKALRILNWVHKQWEHDGGATPVKNDALSILKEVKEGKRFRCVEYGIVATAALNAIGLPARVLALKTKDVETTEVGAGHVLLEVFLKDMNKWVLMDGQWDVMPVLNNVPLNAVEFQQAIANHYDALQIRSMSGADKQAYTQWIFPYLYYFDVKFDNREGADLERAKQNGKQSLMLVPVGAKQPAIFQKQRPIDYVLYTNSIADFYASPSK